MLLSRDLIFTTKVMGTARSLGLLVECAGSAAAVTAALAKATLRVVLVDLSAGDLVSPSALTAYRAARAGTPFVAFGSHVDVDALKAAREAGCEEVMPRSRFAAELPAILRRYFAVDL